MIGLFMLGSMPPIDSCAPVRPPWPSRDSGGKAGYWKPKGKVLLVPNAKIGGLVVPVRNVGRMKPGGLPLSPFSSTPSVGQSRYNPNPPRTTHLPCPVGSHATPTRGLKAVMEWLNTCGTWMAEPLPTLVA